MPFGWDDSRDAYNQAYTDDQPNESSFGHELVAGAAAFAGMKVFEDHQRKEGKQVSHQLAKEMVAGFAGAEADKLAETKGMDFYDREKAKHHAKQNAEHLYEQHYERRVGADRYDPNQYGPPQAIQDQFGGYGGGGYEDRGSGGGGYGGGGYGDSGYGGQGRAFGGGGY